MLFNRSSLINVVTMFSFVVQSEPYEIIKLLDNIDILFSKIGVNSIDKDIMSLILQFIVSMSVHEERIVRAFAVRGLTYFINSDYAEMVLLQLSRIIDKEDSDIKMNILHRLDVVSTENNEWVDLIIQKGKIDNHYDVRSYAEKIYQRRTSI